MRHDRVQRRALGEVEPTDCPRGPMSALGGSGRAAPKEKVRVGPNPDLDVDLSRCTVNLVGAYLAWLAHSDCLALASVTHTGQGAAGEDHQGVPMRNHTHLAICREGLRGAPRNPRIATASRAFTGGVNM